MASGMLREVMREETLKQLEAQEGVTAPLAKANAAEGKKYPAGVAPR